MRRLHFEAQSLSISDMKTRVEPSFDAAAKKMPVAERLARQKAQEARLPETMPSHEVVDKLVEMLEQGVLSYLAPGKYVSRAQEIQSVKAEKSISIDGDGNLKVAVRIRVRAYSAREGAWLSTWQVWPPTLRWNDGSTSFTWLYNELHLLGTATLR